MSDGELSTRLRYGSALHNKLKQALWVRYQYSRRHFSEKHRAWREDEERFLSYTPETESDAERRALRERGQPQTQTIILPYSYAMLMAAHTYWTTVFLSRSPIMQFMGRHGEAEHQVQAVEAIMAYQVFAGEHLVPYYIWLMDAGKYGLGVLGTYWEEEEVQVSRIIQQPEVFAGIEIPGTEKPTRVTERVPGYVGNKAFNVKPYNFFPDPRKPVVQFQKGEFCIVRTDMSWNDVARNRDELFNVEALRKRPQSGMLDEDDGSSAHIQTDEGDDNFTAQDFSQRPKIDILDCYIEVVPKEWGIGESDYPEMWYFCLANGNVIIKAEPFDHYHARFPFSVLPYEIEGYALANRSLSEVVHPLQNVMDWLVNSHLFNVRKVMNDQFIVDPSLVVMKDLTDPRPGKLIRLKPKAYSQGLTNQAVQQLQVTDVTQNHLRDLELLAEMMQRALGITDNIMGMLNQGGRKTATEVRSSNTFGINRLKTHAEWMSAVGWAPHATMMLQNTQQFYDLEREFRIAGDLVNTTRQQATMQITPADIVGFFDFEPVDGTMPVDRYAQANLWREMIMGMGKFPALLQQYDVGGMFAWVARLAGLKNIERFKIQLAPDQTLAAQAQAGNVVPLQGMPGGQQSAGGGATDLGRTSEPGQLSGMGQTS
jgi:hypothetical protein